MLFGGAPNLGQTNPLRDPSAPSSYHVPAHPIIPNPAPIDGYFARTCHQKRLKSQHQTHFQANAQDRKVVCAQTLTSCIMEPCHPWRVLPTGVVQLRGRDSFISQISFLFLTVTDGRFAVPLDFGAAFTGQKRVLEIEVRPDTGLACLKPIGIHNPSAAAGTHGHPQRELLAERGIGADGASDHRSSRTASAARRPDSRAPLIDALSKWSPATYTPSRLVRIGRLGTAREGASSSGNARGM